MGGGIGLFVAMGKWDLGQWDWDLGTGNGKKMSKWEWVQKWDVEKIWVGKWDWKPHFRTLLLFMEHVKFSSSSNNIPCVIKLFPLSYLCK